MKKKAIKDGNSEETKFVLAWLLNDEPRKSYDFLLLTVSTGTECKAVTLHKKKCNVAEVWNIVKLVFSLLQDSCGSLVRNPRLYLVVLQLVDEDSGYRDDFSICTCTRMRSVCCCYHLKQKQKIMCCCLWEWIVNSYMVFTGFMSVCRVLLTRLGRMVCVDILQHWNRI